jgi:uncharacterized membrane protein YphA (DoxX/SURF4 family)
MPRNKTLLLIFRIVLGGLFVYAGTVKVADPLGFAQDIRNYRLVGPTLSFVAALVLPWLEILAGACLVAGVGKRGAALVVTGLLVFFIVLTLVTMARGLDVDCGCFGSLSRKSGWGVVFEDLGMLYLGFCVLLAPGKGRSRKDRPS